MAKPEVDAEDFVELTDERLSVDRYVDLVRDPGAGAISTFLGTTRDSFENKVVTRLEYEAYNEMAISVLKQIIQSARAKWQLKKVAVAHRLGVVPVSEASVIIAVSSAHRIESLAAVTFLIDELKAKVPIWKKEVYAGRKGEQADNQRDGGAGCDGGALGVGGVTVVGVTKVGRKRLCGNRMWSLSWRILEVKELLHIPDVQFQMQYRNSCCNDSLVVFLMHTCERKYYLSE
ncbi:hypothetical protein CLOP_g3513 [Closterium sp. NIES-67]|nr:hypothetical protein CLOP_g3513 [Closterium sp. NIES-67]